MLEEGPPGQAISQWLCPDCRGRWCGAKETDQRLGRVRKPFSPWRLAEAIVSQLLGGQSETFG
jgi:hypothetical protein